LDKEGSKYMTAKLTPAGNDSLQHRAAGNLAYLLSVIRQGEWLEADEVAHIRETIDLLLEEENEKKPTNATTT